MNKYDIKMSEEALVKAASLQETNAKWTGKDLRLYIEGKGCDGFYYGVSFDDSLPADVRIAQEGSAIGLLVDPDTLQFVDGARIEWIDDERGQGFLVENPAQKQFRGKFYKRSAWREKFETMQEAKQEAKGDL